MKTLLIIMASFGFISLANAAPKEISKRLLNTVKKNHLVVAKVKHPGGGLKLFDACFDGKNFVSKTSQKVNRCVEKRWVVFEDRKYDIHLGKNILTEEEYKTALYPGYYAPECIRWESRTPVVSKDRRGSKEVNCRWLYGKDVPFGHYAHGDQEKRFDWFNVCDYKSVPSTFPLTQVIDIYRLYDNFSDSVYWHITHEDRAQPGYQTRSYTIPSCQNL